MCSNKFLASLSSLAKFGPHLPAFAVHLWIVHNNGDIVTHKILEEEFVRCAGREFFDEQSTKREWI